MEPSLCYLISKRFIILLCLYTFLFTSILSSTHPLCHENESSALLQFKQSLEIIEPTKIASWKLGGDNTDCCLWEGVDCDENSGHVIGLDLSNSNLYGSINSSSTLFQLVHLQSLNLALNDFNYSEIPARIGQLSRLKYLNLSSSVFSGNVPSETSQLANLSSFDLSYNFDFGGNGNYILKLGIDFTLENLVRNFTKLEYLDLSFVEITSTVPQIMSNLSSPKSLVLIDCGLSGEFPISIFHLPDLRILKLDDNKDLNGHLPEFQVKSPLEIISLPETNFSGKLPTSIGNLRSLVDFNTYQCKFFGSIPAQLGNLKSVTSMDLFGNRFSGLVPSSIGNLTELRFLRLGYNQLTGPFPPQILNLSKLTYLYLAKNNFQGPIPIYNT
ncbi:putative Leucine-rich receptor-like kinase family protein [Quillaja saponaria]|uniref:Leucine-rich receptor-like kinase family protein n=1 Tax=Quillaja saponaria TaxID=32244 RepID=A0AAD7M393_QUISA|nr:putative Leucine-rich receptor-like kinase family protein [Quillaja saponaria]